MSKTARSDDIDALVSSVRDFVSHKDPRKSSPRKPHDRLVLTPEQLVSDSTESSTFAGDSGSDGTAKLHLFQGAKPEGLANLESALSAIEIAMAGTAAAAKRDAPQGSVDGDETAQSIEVDSAESVDEPIPAKDLPTEVPAIGENPPVLDPVDEQPNAEDAENVLAAAGADAMAHDALRALITDIVHEELAGELGERMTRNIRKLVRREINRVLASHELGRN